MAKQCQVCWRFLAESPTPPTLAETKTFGDPGDQSRVTGKKKKKKELRRCLPYVKIKGHTNPCLAQTQRFFKRAGGGTGGVGPIPSADTHKS